MGSIDLQQFRDSDELVTAAAGAWLEELARSQREKPAYTVALSGGRVAGRFFQAVTRQIAASDRSLNTVDFFWSDERCVPPNDPESNFSLAQTHLLAPLAVPVARIHRIRGEDSPERAALAAEADLRRIVASGPNGQPVLDLVFLGLGEDGHVASLFPNEPEELQAAPAVFRHVVGPKPPPNRITMGYATIVAAAQVWVLASGAGKAEALRNSLAPDGATPFARVLHLRALTRVFTDISSGPTP